MIQGLQQANISLDKGIFRTPSMGADGELSECVNLIPHAGELVRIHEPQPLAMEEGANWLSYSCAWYEVNNGYGSFAVKLSQPAPLDLKVTFTLARKDGKEGLTPTLSIGKGSSSASRQVAGFAQYEVVAVKAGDDETDKALKQLGFDGIRAHRPFTASSWDEINGITDWSSAFELPEGYRLLRTHFCAGKENLILSYGKYLVYYRPGEGYTVLFDNVNPLKPFSVDTLGQTLIFSQGLKKHYFLWSEDGYKEHDILGAVLDARITLGESRSLKTNAGDFESAPTANKYEVKVSQSKMKTANVEPLFLRRFGRNYSGSEELPDDWIWYTLDKKKEISEYITGVYNEVRGSKRRDGAACFPFYVRYGVELYDGSVINLSSPVLMMPSTIVKPRIGCYVPDRVSQEVRMQFLETDPISDHPEKYSLTPLLTPRYLYAAFDASTLKNLSKDLIKGVAVYVTKEIEISSGKLAEVDGINFKPSGLETDGFGNEVNKVESATDGATPSPGHVNYIYTYRDDSFEDTLTSAYQDFIDPVNFYKLALIPVEFLEENGYKAFVTVGNGCFRKISDPEFWSNGDYTDKDGEYDRYVEAGYKPYEIDRSVWENITSQGSLSSVLVKQDNAVIVSSNCTYDYNSRFLYGGIIKKLNPSFSISQLIGDSRLPSMRSGGQVEFYLRENEKYKTLPANGDYLLGYKGESLVLLSSYTGIDGFGFDSKGGDVYSGSVSLADTQYNSVGQYSRWTQLTKGQLRNLTDLKELFMPVSEKALPGEWEKDDMYNATEFDRKPNAVAVTKVANPWVIEAVYELACGEILALSSATEALSEGQFGEFPVYAFTDNGIYALSVSDTGAIAAKQPISREVLSAPNAVLQLDNAVVFPTKAGLRHLSGRTVTPLSDTINGFNINEALYDTPPELTIADRQPFNEQIQNCRMLYDPANRLIHIFNDLEGDEATPAAVQHRWAESLEPVSTDNGWYMRSDLSRIEIPGGTRQKHYVLDIPSGQWATQILPQKLTACVPGYPFSTMQFGRSLMQYTSELEKDTLRPGWLITRPVAFGDLFARKMLADIRAFGQKTSAGTAFRIRVYTSEDRTHWHPLSSLKSRSAKWYRFLVKADMTGLDTLSGLACQYVQRLGQKLR